MNPTLRNVSLLETVPNTYSDSFLKLVHAPTQLALSGGGDEVFGKQANCAK